MVFSFFVERIVKHENGTNYFVMMSRCVIGDSLVFSFFVWRIVKHGNATNYFVMMSGYVIGENVELWFAF